MTGAVAGGALDTLAAELLRARQEAVCVPLVTERMPAFSLADAYALATRTTALRTSAGDLVRGYKIGFTNRSIWPRYGVFGPIWAPVWASTVSFIEDDSPCHLELDGLSQPRLEPEIVFGIGRTPSPGGSLEGLVGCLDWVAHGFEVVHTHFDGWRFKAADAVADFGLHGQLIVGPRRQVADLGSPAEFIDCLARLTITLYEGSRRVDQGVGSNVLDGPVQALSQWIAGMAEHTPHWPIEAGQVVTTGTITDAAVLAGGQSWRTELSDPRLPGLQLRTGR